MKKKVKRDKIKKRCVVLIPTGEVWSIALYHFIFHIAFSTSYYLVPKTMHVVPKAKQGECSSSSLILFS